MKHTYYIWTIGCQMNHADSRHLAAQMEERGYQPAEAAHLADLIILNTCVIRQQAEDKALDQLRQLKGLKRSRPDLVVAVMGCMVGKKLEAALREHYPFVDVFMGPSETEPLMEFLGGSDLPDAPGSGCGRALPPSAQGRTFTAFVPVVLGCSHACTYCVIPSRRGGERSRPKSDILNEVRELAREGVKEITLLGQIVDRYGTDFDDGTHLAHLLKEAAAIEGVARVRFLTSHPNWFTDELLETVATTDKICPCIEIPVQAGNDEVLARMRRGYTAEQYRRLVAKIRARIPHVAINTDIIVGFPGETEAGFMDTYRLMEELQFDMAHIARYSVRPGTPAARNLEDDVPEEEKERRRVAREALLNESLEKKHAALAGTTVELLVEGKSGRRWLGRTPQNKVVLIEDAQDLGGRIVQATITRTGAFSQYGEIK